MEMWSVVHLPLALISTGMSSMSLLFHALNGSSFCRRFDVGAISTEPEPVGAWYVFSPASKPFGGRPRPDGGLSLNGLPSEPISVSVMGLNVRRPASVMAVTSSGEATNACVSLLPSLRPVKLRL